MTLLDANIIIRYLTDDVPTLASHCENLFKKISRGKETVLLNHLVIAEVVCVLETRYDYPRAKIFESLLKLANTPHIEIPDKELILNAFAHWYQTDFKVDYIDAYNAAWVTSKKLKGIYSYDSDFEQLKITRLEP